MRDFRDDGEAPGFVPNYPDWTLVGEAFRLNGPAVGGYTEVSLGGVLVVRCFDETGMEDDEHEFSLDLTVLLRLFAASGYTVLHTKAEALRPLVADVLDPDPDQTQAESDSHKLSAGRRLAEKLREGLK
jgi:hypothetical protein